jgi:hypothetical protein
MCGADWRAVVFIRSETRVERTAGTVVDARSLGTRGLGGR